jgi:hypothetical protein
LALLAAAISYAVRRRDKPVCQHRRANLISEDCFDAGSLVCWRYVSIPSIHMRSVVITGTSSGIGHAAAKVLLAAV